ncbi:MAG: beta-lactamase family protein [Rhodobacteraceae bacterium]|nr:beta-lactamase family protein [Paracoccaceae bacterium]
MKTMHLIPMAVPVTIPVTVFAMLATSMLTACAPQQADQIPVSALESVVYDTAQAQVHFEQFAENFPALNVTVMVDNEIVWESAGGVNTDAGDGVTAAYNFYSSAKMLTGMAFARLESTKGVDLDRSIRRIDPALPAPYENITLRQLLSHTAGVRHYTSRDDWIAFNDRRCKTPQEALAHFIDDDFIAEPGEKYSYSTYGFTLLSHLLVKLTDAPNYDAAMQDVLGDAYLARTDSDTAKKAVTYYAQNEDAEREALPLSAECKFGGGGLLASSRELSAMGAAFANGDIVSAAHIDENLTFGMDAPDYRYGMGGGYSDELQAHFISHSGGSVGGRSYLLVFIEPNVSVALTSNFDGPNHGDTAMAIGRIFVQAQVQAENQ